MSSKTSSWTKMTLGQVAKWSSGGTPKRSNHAYYGGDIPWVKTGDLGERYLTEVSEYISEEGLKNSSAKLFPRGSIGLAMYGATIGKVSIFGIDAACNQACAVAVPNEKVIQRYFLYYLLKSEKEAFIKKGKGGAQPNISQTIIKEHEISIPPVSEQKRIADKLDSVLAKVEAAQARLDKIPAILKRFRQSVLAAATSGELTKRWREVSDLDNIDYRRIIEKNKYDSWISEQLEKFDLKGKLPKTDSWKKKYKAPELPNSNMNTALPISWDAFTLEEISKIVSDGDHNPPKKISVGKRHLTIKCINNGKIDFTYCAYVSEAGFIKTNERYSPQQDDILITCIGTIGRVAVVAEDTEFSTDRNIAYSRLLDVVNSNYIKLALESPLLQEQMRANQSGNAQPALYLKSIRKLEIPLPTLKEQKEIVIRTEELFGKAALVEKQFNAAKARLDKLTQSILAKAFKGELLNPEVENEFLQELSNMEAVEC